MAAGKKPDRVMWCVCADYIRHRNAQEIGQAATDAPDSSNERWAIIRAATSVMCENGDLALLDRLADGVLLLACPYGDTSSNDDRELRVASLCQEIRRRWHILFSSLPNPTGAYDPFISSQPAWDLVLRREHLKALQRWHSAHSEMIAGAFDSWAMSHPEADKESDFATLIDALAAIWLASRPA